MKKNELFFKSEDKETNIHMVMWEPEDKIYGVIQVIHGVTEHIMRYEEMASYLTKGGIALVGIDLLGHGLSTNNGSKKMYFGREGSWNYVVADINTCYKMTKEIYTDVPYVMLGFSLGSFLLRTYLINYPGNVDGAILVGTGQMSNISLNMARSIAVKECKKYGESSITEKIRSLTFDTYNKNFKPNRTKYDWLCSSNESLDKYISDPLRGEAMSCGLFREMLDGMKYTGNKKNISKMDINKPVLFLSGTNDPVGDFGKGVSKAYKLFKNAGICDVGIKMYDGLRHDILHEDNRYSIYDDIYGWMRNKILRSVQITDDNVSLINDENQKKYEQVLIHRINNQGTEKKNVARDDMVKQQQNTLNIKEEKTNNQVNEN